MQRPGLDRTAPGEGTGHGRRPSLPPGWWLRPSTRRVRDEGRRGGVPAVARRVPRPGGQRGLPPGAPVRLAVRPRRDVPLPPGAGRRDGLDRVVPARHRADHLAGPGVSAARPGGRGRDQRPPAAQAGAVRRHPVRGAARRPLPTTSGRRSSSASCTCSSGRASWSPSGTARRRTWPRCGGGWRPRPQMLARGPEAVLYAILDQVVDGYAPVVAGLENDIDEIETQVFGGDPNASRAHLRASAARSSSSSGPPARCSACSTRWPSAFEQHQRRRGAAPLPARRDRPPDPGGGAGGRVPAPAAEHPHRQRHPGRRSSRTRRCAASPRPATRRTRS